MGPIAGQILLQFVFIAINAIFAATEIALISLNENKLRRVPERAAQNGAVSEFRAGGQFPVAAGGAQNKPAEASRRGRHASPAVAEKDGIRPEHRALLSDARLKAVRARRAFAGARIFKGTKAAEQRPFLPRL